MQPRRHHLPRHRQRLQRRRHGRRPAGQEEARLVAGRRAQELLAVHPRAHLPHHLAGLRHGGRARRLTYDLTAKNNITLYVLESYSDLDRSSVRSQLGINSLMGGGYHYTLGNLSWRYSPTGKLLVVNHAAWMREKFTDSNPPTFRWAPAITASGFGTPPSPGCGTRAARSTPAGPCAACATEDPRTSTRRIRRRRVCSITTTGPPCTPAATCSSPGWPGPAACTSRRRALGPSLHRWRLGGIARSLRGLQPDAGHDRPSRLGAICAVPGDLAADFSAGRA